MPRLNIHSMPGDKVYFFHPLISFMFQKPRFIYLFIFNLVFPTPVWATFL